jgi:hypothetical protein
MVSNDTDKAKIARLERQLKRRKAWSGYLVDELKRVRLKAVGHFIKGGWERDSLKADKDRQRSGLDAKNAESAIIGNKLRAEAERLYAEGGTKKDARRGAMDIVLYLYPDYPHFKKGKGYGDRYLQGKIPLPARK